MGLRAVIGRWLLGPAYEGAAVGPRTRSFITTGVGPTAAIAGSGETMRNRSAQLLRNNPWAYAAVESFAASAVGTGVKPRSRHDDPAIRKQLNLLFEDWTDEAVSEGIGDLYAAQLVAANTVLEGGDCFVRLRPRQMSDKLTVPLQLNLYSGVMVPYWYTTPLANGRTVICGIEFDVLGRKRAYYFHREHPGEYGLGGARDAGGLVRVDASEVLHLFRWRIAGQIRGEQALARALLRLNDLDEHDQTELIRQKNASAIVMAIASPDPDKLPKQFGEPADDDPGDDGETQVVLKPGTVPVLDIGQTLQSHIPPDVGPNYEAFIEHQLRGIAQATGITFEQLTGNYRQVNYSSGRLGALEHRRKVEPWQYAVIVYQLCRPLWAAFVDAAVSSGAIRIPGYAAKRREALRVRWHPQGWPWVDPLKDGAANMMARRGGWKSLGMIAAEQGHDLEEVLEEIAAENELLDRLGLVLDCDPRKVTQTGIAVNFGTGDAPEEPAPERAAGGRR